MKEYKGKIVSVIVRIRISKSMIVHLQQFGKNLQFWKSFEKDQPKD